jgi:YegS/Rv2252/BmrU family lipid kinase
VSDFTFILNPSAGKGVAGRLRSRILSALQTSGLRHEFLETGAPGHATLLARASESQTVVAIGGDGTVNEVANGIVGSGRRLGIIPAGSGNDLIKSVNVPRDLKQALRILLKGKTRKIDLGLVSTGLSRKGDETGSTVTERVFVNGVGVGFDAAVAVRTREIPVLRGTALYLLAALQTLGRYKSPLFDVVIDGKRRTGRNLLMAIGNGRCAGGGFFLTPDAVVDDGLLDVCIIEKLTIPEILRLMPKVLRGRHHSVRQVKFDRGTGVTITSEVPFYVHADGEIVGQEVRSVEARIAPHGIQVIVDD